VFSIAFPIVINMCHSNSKVGRSHLYMK
jgi:hypothetical protein